MYPSGRAGRYRVEYRSGPTAHIIIGTGNHFYAPPPVGIDSSQELATVLTQFVFSNSGNRQQFALIPGPALGNLHQGRIGKHDKTEKKAIPSGLTDLVAIQFHSEKTKTHTIHDAISHAVI